VLFLDDLQWIDPATLSLLAHVARHPDTHHLLLLGAYRDNEVDPSHPLARAIERLRDEGVAVDTIVPEPLSSDDVSHLVADTLHCEPSRCEALASLVHAKTEGNPLFFTQFLSALHEEGLLAFHRERREWTWDLAGIQVRQHADSVVKLMAAKFRQLPEPTQRVLRLAGCLGHGLDLETLALLSGQSLKETEEDLSEAIERGIVRRGVGGTLRFVHDRVQEAAYALIPPNDRARVHLQIGRLLAAHEGGALGERVFDVVSQFRRGAPLLEAQERIRLAELELEAGRRAAASMAHRSAVQHFAEGQTFLPADRWQSHYALSYALALERARCEWLSGDFAAAESSIAALMREARARAERTDVYRLRIDLLTTLNETEDCVRTALEACAELFGLEVPLHPSPEALEKAVGAVLQQLHGRNVDELAELPAMTDPDMQALLALISSLAPTAYFLDPLVESIMACEIVRRSLLHGNSPHSSHGYMSLALILGFRLDRWDEALQFTRLACRLADKYAGGSEVATYFLAGMLEFQLCPLYEAVDRLRFAWQAAVDGGDTNHGCYAGWGLVGYRLMSGEPLTNVAEEARVQFEFARSVNYVEIRDAFLLTARFIESLRGNTERLGSLDGPDFDSGALESRLAKSSYPHGPESYHLNRAFGEFLAGNYAAALEASDRARDCLPDGPINYTEGHRFFRALAAAGRHDEVPPEERSPLLGALHDSVRSLRAQARRNPATFGPRHALVAAEVARIEGRDIDALRGYEEAISSAREGGFVHLEGMASEAAARFHRQRGWMTGAAAHLRAAHAAYSHWGAMAKVKALEVEHPELRPEHPGQTPAAGRAGIPQLDFLAAARASQAISGQTDLARLLDTLLRTVLESACAQAGWLILASGESLSLAARATANEHGIEVEVFPEPPGYMAELPDSILSYARRSRGPVVLGDAAVPNPFSTDEALRRRGARSVLCLPIIRQGILTALLYLENRLLPGLFTPERLALLELLATQAAISLELGQHKKQLTELVTRRTEELTRANESLRNANRRLEQAHRQLLHSEKMASIGQLAAGVAHEINNPVACISSNLGTLDSYLDDVMRVVRTYQECDEVLPPSHQAKVRAAKEEADLEQVHDDLGSLVADTKHALDRVKKIVFALRSLAHVGESEWQLADIRPGLESTLNLLRNELGRKAVVVIEFGETPPLECLPSDLNQVFMNVLMNAAQAISGRGTITVRTGRLGEEVWVEVSDTGQGIAPENMKRIFDPFFTTKPVGEGTGLGLSLSYGIVEKHHGRIEVASEPGQGTRFRIWLPVRQPAADAA
ncbi:MAG TPA: ATP-binding protein, partial [Anaeromyxobacteraceae bacterium]|nr:ATP-binding protein [Anaeromyxobacteraceae bacterium]